MCRKTKVGDVSTPGPQKPPDSSPNVPDAQQDKAADTVKRLIQGSEMLKYGRRGFPHRRPVRVTLDRSAVLVSYDTKIPLASVKEVRTGQTTPVFQRKPNKQLEPLSFSLIYDPDYTPGSDNSSSSNKTEERSLDLVANDTEEYKAWTQTLPILIEAAKSPLAATSQPPTAEQPAPAPAFAMQPASAETLHAGRPKASLRKPTKTTSETTAAAQGAKQTEEKDNKEIDKNEADKEAKDNKEEVKKDKKETDSKSNNEEDLQEKKEKEKEKGIKEKDKSDNHKAEKDTDKTKRKGDKEVDNREKKEKVKEKDNKETNEAKEEKAQKQKAATSTPTTPKSSLKPSPATSPALTRHLLAAPASVTTTAQLAPQQPGLKAANYRSPLSTQKPITTTASSYPSPYSSPYKPPAQLTSTQNPGGTKLGNFLTGSSAPQGQNSTLANPSTPISARNSLGGAPAVVSSHLSPTITATATARTSPNSDNPYTIDINLSMPQKPVDKVIEQLQQQNELLQQQLNQLQMEMYAPNSGVPRRDKRVSPSATRKSPVVSRPSVNLSEDMMEAIDEDEFLARRQAALAAQTPSLFTSFRQVRLDHPEDLEERPPPPRVIAPEAQDVDIWTLQQGDEDIDPEDLYSDEEEQEEDGEETEEPADSEQKDNTNIQNNNATSEEAQPAFSVVVAPEALHAARVNTKPTAPTLSVPATTKKEGTEGEGEKQQESTQEERHEAEQETAETKDPEHEKPKEDGNEEGKKGNSDQQQTQNQAAETDDIEETKLEEEERRQAETDTTTNNVDTNDTVHATFSEPSSEIVHAANTREKAAVSLAIPSGAVKGEQTEPEETEETNNSDNNSSNKTNNTAVVDNPDSKTNDNTANNNETPSLQPPTTDPPAVQPVIMGKKALAPIRLPTTALKGDSSNNDNQTNTQPGATGNQPPAPNKKTLAPISLRIPTTAMKAPKEEETESESKENTTNEGGSPNDQVSDAQPQEQ